MTQAMHIQQNTLHNIVETLNFLKENFVSKKDMDSYLETIEILNNKETMKTLKQSREDIKHNRVKKIKSFDDLVKAL